MKFLTFISGLFAALPFVVLVEPFYSGYLSLLILLPIVDIKNIDANRLGIYIIYVFLICISLINVDYSFKIKELAIGIVLPSIFLFTDLKLDFKSFFKGVDAGVLVVIFSLIYLAYQKKLITNFTTFFTSERDWGSESAFYGNGTALVLTLVASYYLVNDKISKAIIINSAAILTTSRIPLFMFAFIIFYLIFVSKIRKSYKLILTLLISITIFYIFIYVSGEDSLLNRFTRSEDREFIFNYSYKLFKENIFLGFGPQEIPIYKHLHNSFFEVLFRYGVITFIFYLVLVIKGNFFNAKLKFLIFLAFFYTFTQINLHNVNYMVILAIAISHLKLLNRKNENFDKRISP